MDEGPFDDGDALGAIAEVSDAELAATVASLVRADLTDAQPGGVMRAFDAAAPSDRVRLAYAWNDAMAEDGLGDWIAADAGRRRAAAAIAPRLTPPDPGDDDAALAALATFAAFTDWSSFAFPLLVVPGYTPTDAVPAPGVHSVTRRRLEIAAAAFADGTAPFVLVSGGNVHPRGTTVYEAVEMKKAIVPMGVPADRILLDARARTSMTNLRNAGRVLLVHGLGRALVVTLGGGIFGSDVFGQDFYFANPDLSTFNFRCERELGYRVGALAKDGDHRIAFTPAPEVVRVAFRDALDP
jgi:hypothetical protein